MSSRDTRRRDDRRDSRRDRRVVDDPRDSREYRDREARDGGWSEWTWSSEHNSYYRHRTDSHGQPEYQFHAQPGVSPQTSAYPGPSNAQAQSWNPAPVDNRADWGRPSHQPAPPPLRANDPYLAPTQPPVHSYPTQSQQMPPPGPRTGPDGSHRPPSGGAGRGRDVRDPRGPPSRPPEKQDYFIPGDGIDREVITADICRYLDNDALVRPGTYRNPRTGQNQAGYFITSSSPLTPEHIADLKADTQRWHEERQSRGSRGDVYRHSQVHDSRQYHGPSNIYGVEVPSTSNRFSNPSPEADPRSTNYPSPASIGQLPHPQHIQTPSVSPGYPLPAAGNQYGQPQNYITSGGGNYYSSDVHPTTPQERQIAQVQGGFTQPRSAAFYDPQSQASMADSTHATGDHSQTVAETQTLYTATARPQNSTTTTTGFGQVPTSTNTTRIGRTESGKRQRSHDPDEMDYSD